MWPCYFNSKFLVFNRPWLKATVPLLSGLETLCVAVLTVALPRIFFMERGADYPPVFAASSHAETTEPIFAVVAWLGAYRLPPRSIPERLLVISRGHQGPLAFTASRSAVSNTLSVAETSVHVGAPFLTHPHRLTSAPNSAAWSLPNRHAHWRSETHRPIAPASRTSPPRSRSVRSSGYRSHCASLA
jgi:hypothetical protein